MWYELSLIAILFWSFGDMFTKMSSERENKYSHWKIVICVGGVMGIHAVLMLLLGAEFHPIDLIRYLPASACYIASMTVGYFGLRYLLLSINSPVSNASGALVVIMCLITGDIGKLKENLVLNIVGTVCIVTGIIAIAILEKRYGDIERRELGENPDKKYTHSAIALLLPIAYCIIDALGTYIDGRILVERDEYGRVVSGYIEEASGNIAYEFTFLLMAVIAFIFVVVIKKEKLFTKKTAAPLTATGICETAGQLAYVYAISNETVRVAPLISCYSLFSLVWARIFLKEKLTKAQYAALAIAAVGIVAFAFTE